MVYKEKNIQPHIQPQIKIRHESVWGKRLAPTPHIKKREVLDRLQSLVYFCK